MSRLPYRWIPLGSTEDYRMHKRVTLDVGVHVAYDHAVWRVTEVAPDTDDGRHHVLIVPAALYDHPDPVVRANATKSIAWTGRHGRGLPLYPDGHYPICAQCHEPLPCREQMAEEVAEKSAERAARYDTPSVCPSCLEPVTERQKSITFTENIYSPIGPPVTYHLRRKCYQSAIAYEKQWHAEDPEHRKMRFTCPGGRLINHGDGTYYCSNGVECPGPTAQHQAYDLCACPEHPRHTNPAFRGRGCYPPPDATLSEFIGERGW